VLSFVKATKVLQRIRRSLARRRNTIGQLYIANVPKISHKVKVMEPLFRNFALVCKPARPETASVASQIQEILRKFGAQSRVYEGCPESLTGHDIVVPIGGDGTFLRCVPTALASKLPLVGVNMGRLGYLVSISKDNLQENLSKVIHGEYTPTHRMVLKATLSNGEARYALNELAIKSAEYRLASLKLSADNESITRYDCDGLILSTPTGSTAYNLSAGGPLLHLKTDAIVVTPICAHSLTNRSLVFNSRSYLRVEPGDKPSRIHINADGHTIAEGDNCLPVQIRQATRKLVILEDPARASFDTLREKLDWK